MINNSKRSFGVKTAFVFFLVMCMMLTQMSTVFAWQPDKGDGTFTNPVMYADYPDPSMIRVGNYFYLASSTFVNSPGLVICKSEDLVNWEIAGHCIDKLSDAYNMTNGTTKYAAGCFAPSIAYKDGTFYVIVNLNDGSGARIYYSKDVSGTWKYYNLGASYFDPCIFIDTDGTPYIAYGGAYEKQISMIQLKPDLSGTVGSSRTICTYGNIEGSHITKVNGKYYLFNAVPARSLVCSRASSVWGPYGETTTLCTAGKGGHQGGIVDLPDGSYWGYLHQDDGAPGRMTRICPITWQNGWPMFGREGHLGQVENTYTKPIQNKAIKMPQASDEFNDGKLGLQWMWNHNPDNTKWSLTGTSLRLNATTASDFWKARNSLTQKGQGLISTATIKIDCSKMQPSDIGGLGMLGDPRGYIAVTGSPRKIIMTEEEVVKGTATNITSNILYLRIQMDMGTKKATFYWKDDTKNWQQLGTAITMGFDWQYGTFQGEQYAIMNFSPNASTGYMDVDWFRLNDEPGPNAPEPEPISAFTQIEAENFYTQSGTQTEDNTTGGGQNIGYIENGDYLVFKNVDFGNGATSFQASAGSETSGGNIELHLDSLAGTLIGTCAVSGTGGWKTFADAKCSVSGATGKHDLYVKFTGESGYLMNLDWFKFTGGEISTGKLGDINSDKSIDAIDLMLIKKHLLGTETIEKTSLADLDASGTIDAIDFALMKQYLLGIITTFPGESAV